MNFMNAEDVPLDPPIPDRREVTRLITYRGSAEAMEKQLGRSLPDGLRQGKIDITVRTLEDTAGLLLGTADPLAALLRRLAKVECELGAARVAVRDLRVALKEARQEAANARANLAQWQRESMTAAAVQAQEEPAPVSQAT